MGRSTLELGTELGLDINFNGKFPPAPVIALVLELSGDVEFLPFVFEVVSGLGSGSLGGNGSHFIKYLYIHIYKDSVSVCDAQPYNYPSNYNEL